MTVRGGKVVNAAWRRYGAVSGLSLAAITVGWVSPGPPRRVRASFRAPTREEARLKRHLNRLGAITTATELSYVAVNAALAQAGHSRPPLRRALTRRSR